MKGQVIRLVMVLAILNCAIPAFATDDYVVVQRQPFNVGNSTSPTRVLNFNLPERIRTGANGVAVLQFFASGINDKANEVYINPPTQVCTDNGDGDANQEASVHVINEGMNHRAFKGNRLQASTTCVSDDNCPISHECSAGLCGNVLLICTRQADGSIGGNVDDIDVHSVVVHFKVP